MSMTPWGTYPDALKHKRISLVKSAMRIAGSVLFLFGYSNTGISLFLAAELLGIWEELV